MQPVFQRNAWNPPKVAGIAGNHNEAVAEGDGADAKIRFMQRSSCPFQFSPCLRKSPGCRFIEGQYTVNFLDDCFNPSQQSSALLPQAKGAKKQFRQRNAGDVLLFNWYRNESS